MSFTEFLKRFLTVLFILLLWVGAWAARATLIMGFAAIVIAVGISIPAGWLERRGWRRGWAIVAAIVTVGLLITLLLVLVVPRLAVELVNLFNNIPQAINSLAAAYRDLRQRSPFFSAALPALSTPMTGTDAITTERASAILNQFVNAGLTLAPNLLGGVSEVVAVVTNLIIILFISIFFLIEPQGYIKGSLYLLPQQYHARALDLWNLLYQTIKTWLTSVFLSISITATLVWLILGVLLGMPNSVVVAVFAGFATFIPNIGALLPLIPIIIFTLPSDPTRLAILVPIYLTIQLVESNVITPAIVKAELNILPGIILLFQLLVTLAFGALGLLLAVPLFGVLMVLVREIYSYGLLGLRHAVVEIKADEEGHFQLKEATEGDTVSSDTVGSDTVSTKPVQLPIHD